MEIADDVIEQPGIVFRASELEKLGRIREGLLERADRINDFSERRALSA
jgi:hypothetical protein